MEYLGSLYDPHCHVSQPLISVLSEKAHFVTFCNIHKVITGKIIVNELFTTYIKILLIVVVFKALPTKCTEY